jgi:hypothetical protein
LKKADLRKINERIVVAQEIKIGAFIPQCQQPSGIYAGNLQSVVAPLFCFFTASHWCSY